MNCNTKILSNVILNSKLCHIVSSEAIILWLHWAIPVRIKLIIASYCIKPLWYFYT